ncbi:hybrid sensor histidine kinase/response regulator [Candidatus Sumerlaeota bacterium]|nr:hybrid sensor histidine kinase/response regulator [Candidatus Sumerlaeota bacterium]
MTELLNPEDIRACPVLYVDDEPDNLTGFRMTFRRLFRVLTAESGAEALEIMRQEPVGVLVTDQRMPGMTGVELIAHAKDLYPDTVYLILTGYSDFDAMVAGINTGVLSGYISKPWERAEVETILIGSIERHLLAVHLRARTEELEALNRALERKVRERTMDLEEANAALCQVNAELAQLNRLKDEFVAFCSHDLKSPLSALTGFVELMTMRARSVEGAEVLDKTLKSMGEVVEEMTSLVHHILDLSRLESGRERLSFVHAPLMMALDHAMTTARPLAEQKGIELVVEAEPMPAIPHDIKRMAQVIGNLISNAVKFTEPGGWICVRMYPGKSGRQCVEVQDTGIGIEPEVCQRIFTEGQAHRRPGTAGEKSSGLGLSICRQIVDMHSGEIAVKSTPGVGSVFHVSLPPVSWADGGHGAQSDLDAVTTPRAR